MMTIDQAMRVTAPHQEVIRKLLTERGKPMSLKEITNSCSLTYHQVTSGLLALTNKGLVKRVHTGIYEPTEDAINLELSPEAQIDYLRNRVNELENFILLQLGNTSKALGIARKR